MLKNPISSHYKQNKIINSNSKLKEITVPFTAKAHLEIMDDYIKDDSPNVSGFLLQTPEKQKQCNEDSKVKSKSFISMFQNIFSSSCKK